MDTAISDLSTTQINAFFKRNAPQTQDECAQMAEQLIGAPVQPSVVQGATSYTVVPVDDSIEFVVQFRAADDAFDLGLLTYVQDAYGQRFVPRHQDSGRLGALRVYKMDNIRGVSVYLARNELRMQNGSLLAIAVQDFAK